MIAPSVTTSSLHRDGRTYEQTHVEVATDGSIITYGGNSDHDRAIAPPSSHCCICKRLASDRVPLKPKERAALVTRLLKLKSMGRQAALEKALSVVDADAVSAFNERVRTAACQGPTDSQDMVSCFATHLFPLIHFHQSPSFFTLGHSLF
eukprot:8786252-Karenia_brevis.AAC.1